MTDIETENQDLDYEKTVSPLSGVQLNDKDGDELRFIHRGLSAIERQIWIATYGASVAGGASYDYDYAFGMADRAVNRFREYNATTGKYAMDIAKE